MDKDLLTASVVEVLTDAGFMISERCTIRPRSFDLAARQGDLLLLLKVLSNIDGLNEKSAVEICRLASHLLGKPLLIGEKTRDQYLERGAVYFRYGVPTLSLDTLADYLLDKTPPLVYAAHGGLYVRIKGEILRTLRLERGVSLGELGAALGVSRRTISKYESESMDTSIDVALRLEEIFDRELIKAVDIFMPSQVDIESAEIEDGILQHLAEIGLQVFPMFQAPFNAITRGDEMTFLTGIGRFSSGTVKRARLMSNLSSIAMTRSAVIIDGETRINRIEETALIELKELKGIDKGRDFADLVMEKQARDEPDFAGKL